MNSRDGSFVGAHTHRDTPVPIPNTAVKPVGPMILLQRESRSVPALKEEPCIARCGVLFYAHCHNLTPLLKTSS